MYRCTVVLLGLLLSATPLTAQNLPSAIRTRLDAASSREARGGYRVDPGALRHHGVTGVLPRDGSVALVVDLTAGRDYQILGVCDTVCEDLDLRLFDPTNMKEPMEQNVLVDDVPVLDFTAERTGSYLLFVDLAECSEEYCYFGVSVLTK